MTEIRYEMPVEWRAYARQLGMSDAGYANRWQIGPRKSGGGRFA